MSGRDLAGYRTSRDYAELYRLSASASYVCVVDWRRDAMRDVAQTIAQGSYRTVACRGVLWVTADNEQDFSQQCATCNLEWIVPEAMRQEANAQKQTRRCTKCNGPGEMFTSDLDHCTVCGHQWPGT